MYITIPISNLYIAFLFAIKLANLLACIVELTVQLFQLVWYKLKLFIINTCLYNSSKTSIIIFIDLPAYLPTINIL